jgi:alkyl sulfatase BDS1-like metallo-beta-lactamase superfamily hydrolase
MFYPKRKKILVKDLKIGDLVVGSHLDEQSKSITVIAGTIIIKKESETADGVRIQYYVKPPSDKPVELAGFLYDNEIEAIDPETCATIIDMFGMVIGKAIARTGGAWETSEKINEMRHKSRKELEEKYAVVEA